MTVEQGDTLYVTSASYAGTTVNPGEYTTLFFHDTNDDGSLDNNDLLVGSENTDSVPSMNGALGGDPAEIGDYFAVVIYGDDPWTGEHTDADGKLTKNVYYGNYADEWQQVQPFSVVEAQKSLEGAVAYEVKGDSLSDEELKYDGEAITFAFKANGEKLNAGDYTIKWTHQTNNTPAATITDMGNGTFSVTEVGEYTAMLYGQGAYAGTEAEVTVVVSPIDLSTDAITVDMVPSATGVTVTPNGNSYAIDMNQLVVRVNGEILGAAGKAKLGMNALRFTHMDGSEYYNGWTGTANQLGVWDVQVSDLNTHAAAVDVIGGPQNIEITVIGQVANLTYDGIPLVETVAGEGDGYFPRTFNNAQGTSFNPNLIQATVLNEDDQRVVVDHEITVTRDGEDVTGGDYTQPGRYTLTVDVPVATQFAYGAKPSENGAQRHSRGQ